MPTNDERTMALLIYVSSLFFPLLAPLLIWLWKKDESKFVDYHGREYFNFLISYTIYGAVAGILVFLLIGLLLLPVVGAAAIIFTIIAAVKSYNGDEYRIPLIFRIL